MFVFSPPFSFWLFPLFSLFHSTELIKSGGNFTLLSSMPHVTFSIFLIFLSFLFSFFFSFGSHRIVFLSFIIVWSIPSGGSFLSPSFLPPQLDTWLNMSHSSKCHVSLATLRGYPAMCPSLKVPCGIHMVIPRVTKHPVPQKT